MVQFHSNTLESMEVLLVDFSFRFLLLEGTAHYRFVNVDVSDRHIVSHLDFENIN